MHKTIPVWMVVGLAVAAGVTWAGLSERAAVFDGMVESTSGGYMFPDATIQTTAAGAVGSPPKKFYLTSAQVQGGAALTACAGGYHMASGWELGGGGGLEYDSNAPGALQDGDLGEGDPPMGSFTQGWLRTGVRSNATSSDQGEHCQIWTSSDNAERGTAATLKTPFGGWGSAERTCDTAINVWCIED